MLLVAVNLQPSAAERSVCVCTVTMKCPMMKDQPLVCVVTDCKGIPSVASVSPERFNLVHLRQEIISKPVPH